MLATILGWINPVGKILGEITKWQQIKADAKTEQERIAADERIADLKGRIDLAKDAAEFDRWWSPRTLMAYCATLYVAKIVAWDTVFELGVTADPGSQVKGIVMVIVGFYFGSKAVSDIGTKLLSAFKR